MRHGWSCLFRTDPSCHHKGSLEPSQSLISKFIMLFSIYKVKKMSTTVRWLGNWIILLLSSLLPINLVAKAGHQVQDAASWASCGNGSLDLLWSLQFLRRACLLWLGSLNPIGSYCCKRRAKRVGSEESALYPPIREKKYYQCCEVVTKWIR